MATTNDSDSIVATATTRDRTEATIVVIDCDRSISHNRLINNAHTTATTTTIAAPTAGVIDVMALVALATLVASMPTVAEAPTLIAFAIVAFAAVAAFIAAAVAVPSPKGIGIWSEIKNGQSQHRQDHSKPSHHFTSC
jgi:hypothetical protein